MVQGPLEGSVASIVEQLEGRNTCVRPERTLLVRWPGHLAVSVVANRWLLYCVSWKSVLQHSMFKKIVKEIHTEGSLRESKICLSKMSGEPNTA